MDLTVLSYVIYLLVSVVLTVWVARTLSRAGRVFLAQVFRDSELLADAVSHLLVVGFYLVNLGFVSLFLKTGATIDDARQVFEKLSEKLGVVLLVLGGMHLANVFVLNKIRSNGARDTSVPPVPPVAMLAPYGPVGPVAS
jgi:cytochrome c biogenesis protein CcdA